MVNVDNLPRDLTTSGLFCCWRYEERDGRKTKVPYNALTGGRAQSNNPDTFAPFDRAVAARGQYDGLGVGIFNGVSAVDIDHCVNEDGTLSPLAQDVVDRFHEAGAYVECSPSGKGVRILFRASGFEYAKDKYLINNQKLGLEVYVSGATQKYVTVTGRAIYRADALAECGDVLRDVLDMYMRRDERGADRILTQAGVARAGLSLSDDELVAKARAATKGERFAALWDGDITGYDSQNEADQALCDYLAFWCGRDAVRMDRLFRASGLMREKWDRPQSGSTYGAITIEKAINTQQSVYDPKGYVKAEAVKSLSGGKDMIGRLEHMKPDGNRRYAWSDIGNGNLFADMYKDVARYVPERKKWYVYDGRRWVPNIDNLRAMELCKRLADALAVYALSIEDEKRRQDYLAYVNRWQRRAYRETILRDAASVHPIHMEEFDADPYVFNCENGTLDLKTGAFNAHRAEDLLSKIAGVRYDPAARCERWERFIREVMQDDMEKAAFLQKALGYTLTGDTRFECFFILYGPTSRNGKGTAMETFMRLMGDYGKSAKPDTIAQKQTANGSGPSEDIARLAGARFVNISEPDQKMVLSAALVKTLTGNDTIVARFLHENGFEYRPDFKLFINTNHLPKVTDPTIFSSGRVKLLLFERHFSEAERDGGLKSELSSPENLSGILNWCIEGLRMIEAQGFDMPDSVREATDEYRNKSDKLGQFLTDEMVQDGLAETRTQDAYQRYTRWCSTNGYFPENAANFKGMLANVAVVTRKRPSDPDMGNNPQALIVGYRLKNGDFDDEIMPTPTPPPAQQKFIAI